MCWMCLKAILPEEKVIEILMDPFVKLILINEKLVCDLGKYIRWLETAYFTITKLI